MGGGHAEITRSRVTFTVRIAGNLQCSFITHTFHNPTHLLQLPVNETDMATNPAMTPKKRTQNTLHPVIQMWSRPLPPADHKPDVITRNRPPRVRWTRRRRKSNIAKAKKLRIFPTVRVSHMWQCCCCPRPCSREPPKQKTPDPHPIPSLLIMPATPSLPCLMPDISPPFHPFHPLPPIKTPPPPPPL